MDRVKPLTDIMEKSAAKMRALDEVAIQAAGLGAFDMAGKLKYANQAQQIGRDLCGLQLDFMAAVVERLEGVSSE